jgi:hypothetical protein
MTIEGGNGFQLLKYKTIFCPQITYNIVGIANVEMGQEL